MKISVIMAMAVVRFRKLRNSSFLRICHSLLSYIRILDTCSGLASLEFFALVFLLSCRNRKPLSVSISAYLACLSSSHMEKEMAVSRGKLIRTLKTLICAEFYPNSTFKASVFRSCFWPCPSFRFLSFRDFL